MGVRPRSLSQEQTLLVCSEQPQGLLVEGAHLVAVLVFLAEVGVLVVAEDVVEVAERLEERDQLESEGASVFEDGSEFVGAERVGSGDARVLLKRKAVCELDEQRVELQVGGRLDERDGLR